jgi:hypothetical protein
MIQNRVEGGDAGTIDDDVVVRMASNVGNARGRIERIKLDLTIGSDYLQLTVAGHALVVLCIALKLHKSLVDAWLAVVLKSLKF